VDRQTAEASLGQPTRILPVNPSRGWPRLLGRLLAWLLTLAFLLFAFAWLGALHDGFVPHAQVLQQGWGLLVCGAFVFGAVWFLRPRGPGARGCLLVGPHGFAQCIPTGAIVVRWEDLGLTWLPGPPEPDTVVVLEHLTGLTLRLGRDYPHIDALRSAIELCLRRHTPVAGHPTGSVSTRISTSSSRSQPSPNFSPWDALPAPTAEAWLDTQAARLLGPLEFTAELSSEGRRLLRQRLFAEGTAGLGCALLGLAIGTALLLLRVAPAWAPSPWFVVVGPLLVGGFATFAAAFLTLWSESANLLGSRLLVGARGWAVWRPTEVRAESWAQLEDDWQPPDPLRLHWTDPWLGRQALFVSELFDHNDRFDQHCRDELQRREARKSGTEPDPVPDGPWLVSVAADEMGPVELVAGPTEEAQRYIQRRLRNWNLGGLAVLAVFLLVLGVEFSRLLHPSVSWFPLWVTIVLTPLWYPCWRGIQWHQQRQQRLPSRLLLGERGLAIWAPERSIMLLWEELGERWSVTLDIPAGQRRAEWFPVRLRLQGQDLPPFLLSDFFEHAQRIEARILAELQRRSERTTPRLASTDITVPQTGLLEKHDRPERLGET
jgi:hypothetical protein